MKNQIQQLMQEQNIQGMLITGPAMHNPPMYYLTGGGHVSNADLILKSNGEQVLFCNGMEREEAAKSGIPIKLYSEFPLDELYKEANKDPQLVGALRYKKMFEAAGVTEGRVVLYGKTDLGQGYALMKGLQSQLPNLELLGNLPQDILMQARATKDSSEIERIKKMSKVTQQVVANTADYLTSRKVQQNKLYEEDGSPVTIGKVKRLIDLWLAERGAENPESTIFAMGRDAGIPHSSGDPDQVLELGVPIVYDIYPCEQGGGYFYDFTRTWCLGYAPDAVQSLYDQVLSVYQAIVPTLKPGMLFSNVQKFTCELFQKMGHPTIMEDPKTDIGYVHSIGHGLGLNVHERPFSGINAAVQQYLDPGCVFTIEPGLYYPDAGMGVRVEDTYTVNMDGSISALSDFPKDLVLPMKGG